MSLFLANLCKEGVWHSYFESGYVTQNNLNPIIIVTENTSTQREIVFEVVTSSVGNSYYLRSYT